jgi:predicted permease
LTFLAALLFGLYPAWRATRIDPSPALKEGVGVSGEGRRDKFPVAKTLVLAQMSLGVLLVSAAVLFTGHLSGIIEQDAGFERGHLLLFDLRPGELGYEGDRLKQFYAEVERNLDTLPGVESVGLARIRPMQGGGFWEELKTPGNEKSASSAVHFGNAEFLATLGVPVLAGRAITAQECAAGLRVAVISESLVRELGLVSPLGATVAMMDQDYQVVGVAQEARYARMTELPSVAYVPFDYQTRSSTVVVRTSISPLAALGAVRETVNAIDPDLPLVEVYTMDQQISRTLQRERLFAWLCGSFGVLALVLCVVGLYGLMSHTTARRTSEMGIRRALGATRQSVMLQVFGEAMILAGAGMALGIPLSLYGVYLVESLELLPAGEWSYGSLAAALAVVMLSAMLAVLAPARRAASIEPMDALRRG